jgi:hypothetical protein
MNMNKIKIKPISWDIFVQNTPLPLLGSCIHQIIVFFPSHSMTNIIVLNRRSPLIDIALLLM